MSIGFPPGFLKTPLGERERGGRGGEGGDKSAWWRESIVSPSFLALSHLEGRREAEQFKRS